MPQLLLVYNLRRDAVTMESQKLQRIADRMKVKGLCTDTLRKYEIEQVFPFPAQNKTQVSQGPCV